MSLDLSFILESEISQKMNSKINETTTPTTKTDVNYKSKLSTKACSVNTAKEPHPAPDWFRAISDMKVKG